MAKAKIVFICRNCGAESPKWVGKCPSCNAWNTYIEEEVVPAAKKIASSQGALKKSKPIPVQDVSVQEQFRILLPDEELNRVLGGGLVPGSVILLGGEPGIGKSTLLLQIALKLPHTKVLYVSGEESMEQLAMRAQRIGRKTDQCYILNETSTGRIKEEVREVKPGLIVIDSIQTLYSPNIDSTPGTITQLRESTHEMQQLAKASGIPVVLVGHITKEGVIAGPKILEHIVDTVLQFEGDRNHTYRILRTIKNRFGSTAEIGIYEMLQDGLRPVANPSEILLSQRNEQLSGIAIAATVEGLRTIVLEIQALATKAVYGTPQRTVNGFDLRRLQMLLAVLEKRVGYVYGNMDVFLNIAGGIRVEDPATDLAVAASLLSSYEDIPLPPDICFAGEIGLSGEVRGVNKIEQRITEAERLGFRIMFISAFHKSIGSKKGKLQIRSISRVAELHGALFQGR